MSASKTSRTPLNAFTDSEVLRFVDLAFGFQDLVPLVGAQFGDHQLKGLVTVQSGVKLQKFVWDDSPELGQGFLEAEQGLRDAVDQRALDVENVA